MSRAAALAPPPPTHSTKHSDDESYSSVDSISIDNGDELVKIVELEACVLAKSVRSEHHAEKRHRADAEFEVVMNEVRLEQGLWQDAEHTDDES